MLTLLVNYHIVEFTGNFEGFLDHLVFSLKMVFWNLSYLAV